LGAIVTDPEREPSMLKPEESFFHRIVKPTLMFFGVLCLGTIGYSVLERLPFLDALFMTVITVTTVGYREVHDLSDPGRIFTIFLIFFGVSAATYFATTVANYLIAGEIKGFLDRRRMQKQIEQLTDHFIVCGYGRMGEQVVREIRREDKPLVIVEKLEAAVDRAAAAGHLVLQGDAEDDNILKVAGVQRAKALVAVLDEDADNLMVIVSARALNEKLYIIARTNREINSHKMIAAGAHRVLFPHALGGRRMAQMAMRPTVAEFLEVVMHDEELELWLEELTIAIGAKLDGLTIGEANIRSLTGANVVALRQRTGKLLAAPTPSTRLQAGDIMVVLGMRSQLNALREMTH
jgi:voltage-gated potassium channel